MLIIVDNAESVVDPQGENARDIYTIIHQLCQIKTICLLITSCIRTVSPRCTCPEIPDDNEGEGAEGKKQGQQKEFKSEVLVRMVTCMKQLISCVGNSKESIANRSHWDLNLEVSNGSETKSSGRFLAKCPSPSPPWRQVVVLLCMLPRRFLSFPTCHCRIPAKI